MMVRQVRSTLSVSVAPAKLSAVVLAVVAASSAMAADNGLQRYSPGIGGSDMTTPLVPGWYVQMPMVAYHANKVKGNDGKDAMGAGVVTPDPANAQQTALFNAAGYAAGVTATYKTKLKAETYALQPRVTYLGTNRLFGANVGFTAMLPLVRRKLDLSAQDVSVPDAFRTSITGVLTAMNGGNAALGGAAAAGAIGNIQAGVAAKVSAASSATLGFGDVEVSPVLHWEIGDHQAVTFAPTIVLPTGDYDATTRTNAGYGNFFTFRPSVQYAYIGDGWDVGARLVLSFNTRNKDNGYFSGNVANVDWQAMKFVSDDVRVGLQGYFVRQYTNDTQDLSGYSTVQQQTLAKTIVNGNKISVNGVGPAVGWLKNGGEMLIEGKFLKEFDARNRTEGQAVWLTVSKPL
ncbi:SphA family protein [Aquabacterium sp.]|uniref:SphA family protein n=1 Tax=Aquabacterium sp. TaxID=1872578 RepID=UPI003B6942FF